MTQKKMKKLKAPKPRNIPLLQHVQRGGAGAGHHKGGKGYRRREKHRTQYKPNPFQREGERQPQAQFSEFSVDRAYYDAVMTLIEDAETGAYSNRMQERFERAKADGKHVPLFIRALITQVPAAAELASGRSDAFAAVVLDVLADAREADAGGLGVEPVWDEELNRVDLPPAFVAEASEDQVRAVAEDMRVRLSLEGKVPAKATRAQLLSFIEGTKSLAEIAQEVDDLPKLRKEYKRVVGKRAPNASTVAELEEAIAEAAAFAEEDLEESESAGEEPLPPRRGGVLAADLRPEGQREGEGWDARTWASGLFSAGLDPAPAETPRRLKKLGGDRERLVAQDQAGTARERRLAGFTEQVATRRTPAGQGAPDGRPLDTLLDEVSAARGILLYKLPTGETQVWIKPVRDTRTVRGWSGLTETFESRQGQASHFAAKAYVQAWRGVVGKNQVRADVRKSRPKTPVYLAVASDPTKMKLILPPLVVDARGSAAVESANVNLDDVAAALGAD